MCGRFGYFLNYLHWRFSPLLLRLHKVHIEKRRWRYFSIDEREYYIEKKKYNRSAYYKMKSLLQYTIYTKQSQRINILYTPFKLDLGHKSKFGTKMIDNADEQQEAWSRHHLTGLHLKYELYEVLSQLVHAHNACLFLNAWSFHEIHDFVLDA